MQITFNPRFRQLLKDYDLPEDLSFKTPIPQEVQTIIDHSGADKEKTAVQEDEDHHFHVDGYTQNTREAFMLGVNTLQLLAAKFEKQQPRNIRCWYHFETREQARTWAQAKGLHQEGDTYYISDRLSYYIRRPGDGMQHVDAAMHMDTALLIIDLP